MTRKIFLTLIDYIKFLFSYVICETFTYHHLRTGQKSFASTFRYSESRSNMITPENTGVRVSILIKLHASARNFKK